MGQAEASGIIEADRKELFYFTDWCYNAPEWWSAVKKTRILRFPDSNGLGKISHYIGIVFGREMEWEAQSVEWKDNEVRKMKATRGMPAKMRMYMKFRFEEIGVGRTKVTAAIGYRAPYPIIGPLIDRFFLRKEAQRLVDIAIEGMKLFASEHKIPPMESQLEKRKADHPGYVALLLSS